MTTEIAAHRFAMLAMTKEVAAVPLGTNDHARNDR
jgi:hypothetical protein